MAWAIITGASAGLGAEFARQLAEQGYDLLLIARRELKLAALARELPNVTVRKLVMDLSQPEAAQNVAEYVREHDLTVEVLVNNAGVGGPDLIEERSWQAQRDFIQLMLVSVAALCHELMPQMIKRRRGTVINVASFAGLVPFVGHNNYGPAKAYMVALSEALYAGNRRSGVHVMALCPGFTHTEFHATGELAEMKAATPGWVWYPAREVVAEGLLAARKRKVVYVSGRLYRCLWWLIRLPFLRSLVRRYAS